MRGWRLELQEVPDECRAFEQLGKMFILRPLVDLKKHRQMDSGQESCASESRAPGHCIHQGE